MRYSLLTQVVFIVVSLIIIFSFIKPMFAEIRTIQDQIYVYSDAVSKANQFNAKLQELINIRNSFSAGDMEMLENFIPTQIDPLEVMHAIESIFAVAEIPINSLSASLADTQTATAEVDFEYDPSMTQTAETGSSQDFSVAFEGSYEDLKEVLGMIEASSLLLEVVDLQFSSPGESTEASSGTAPNDGLYGFKLTLRTYSLLASAQQ